MGTQCQDFDIASKVLLLVLGLWAFSYRLQVREEKTIVAMVSNDLVVDNRVEYCLNTGGTLSKI